MVSPARAIRRLSFQARRETTAARLALALAVSGLAVAGCARKDFHSRQKRVVAVAVQCLDEPVMLLLLHPTEGGRQRLVVGGRQLPSTLPQRENEHIHVAGGPVSRPSHENSVEKCSTASCGNTRRIGPAASACAGRPRESREEIRCRGWRADPARWRRGGRAAPGESAARLRLHGPTGRDPAGPRRSPRIDAPTVSSITPSGLRDTARGRDDSRSPARVAGRHRRSRAGPSR